MDERLKKLITKLKDYIKATDDKYEIKYIEDNILHVFSPKNSILKDIDINNKNSDKIIAKLIMQILDVSENKYVISIPKVVVKNNKVYFF